MAVKADGAASGVRATEGADGLAGEGARGGKGAAGAPRATRDPAVHPAVGRAAAAAERLSIAARLTASRRGSLLFVGAVACVTQIASARWVVPTFETPNAGREIAERIARGGPYEAAYGGRLWGPNAALKPRPRAYLLPAEPLYLAAILRAAAPPFRRYAHVPVTVLLIVSVAGAAMALRGPSFGAAVGVFAALQPFVLIHGPVWDDTFLAAAMVWLVVAILFNRAAGTERRTHAAALRWPILSAAGAVAALARLEAQLILIALAFATAVVPPARAWRRDAVAIAIGVALALGAWAWRNHSAVGSAMLGSTHDGIALWESNGAYTRDALRAGQVMTLSLDAARMRQHWDSTASMTEVEANAYFRRAAIRYALAHPVDVSGTALLKGVLSLTGIRPEMPIRAPRNLIALVTNVVLLVLAMCGAPTLLASCSQTTRARVQLVFGIIVTVGMLMLLIGPIGLRYRITLDGVLWIVAVAGLYRLGSRLGAPSGPVDQAMP